VIAAYTRNRADRIVVERNNGGAMVEHVIRQTTLDVDGVMVSGAGLPITTVWASRGKHTRAEPISVLWMPPEGQPRRGHMVGTHPQLENQCCIWLPGMDSPNNLDAMVWALTELFPATNGGQAIFDHYLNQAKAKAEEVAVAN
jgi:phage terminase large subunit-like protein